MMRRLAPLLLLALVLSACGATEPGSSDDALMPQGETAPPPGPPPADPCAPDAVKQAAVTVFDGDGRQRWTAALRYRDGSSVSSPLVVGDQILTNEGGELRSFDLATGKQHWSVDVGTVYGEWVVDGTLVAVVDQVGANGRVIGLDPRTGARRWEYKAPGRGLLGGQKPTSDGGLAVVQADGSLAVLDTDDGKIRWSVPGSEAPYFTVGAGVVIRTEGNRLVAHDSATGKQRWSVEAGEELLPELVGDVVIPTSGVYPNSAPVAGYHVRDGRRLWTTTFDYEFGTFRATPAGLLIDEGPSGDTQTLVLLDPATGKVRWHIPAQVFLSSEPLVVGEYLVAAEGTPAVSEPPRVVIRRLADGAVHERVEGVSMSDGKVDGDRAYLSAAVDGKGAVVMVQDGKIAWTAPLDRIAQRPPAPVPGGGAAVQTSDLLCARTLEARPAEG